MCGRPGILLGLAWRGTRLRAGTIRLHAVAAVFGAPEVALLGTGAFHLIGGPFSISMCTPLFTASQTTRRGRQLSGVTLSRLRWLPTPLCGTLSLRVLLVSAPVGCRYQLVRPLSYERVTSMAQRGVRRASCRVTQRAVSHVAERKTFSCGGFVRGERVFSPFPYLPRARCTIFPGKLRAVLNSIPIPDRDSAVLPTLSDLTEIVGVPPHSCDCPNVGQVVFVHRLERHCDFELFQVARVGGLVVPAVHGPWLQGIWR